MKKLMLAMLVATVSAVSFGSQVKWTASDVYTPATIGTDTKVKVSGTAAYFFLTADNSGTYTSSIVDRDTILTAIKSGKWDGSGALGGKYTMTGGYAEGSVIGSVDGTDHVYNLTGFVVFLDADTYANSKNFMVSDTVKSQDITGPTGTKNISLGSQKNNSWQSIPEPTSGLLMLLGIAGLAIRRRRA